MQRDDGGNFSNDPYARLLAMKMGSMSVDDLNKQEGIPNQAIDAGAGQVIGSIKTPNFGAIKGALGIAEQAAPAELGLADRIKQAAQNSDVTWKQGPADAGLDKFKQMAQDAPKNFFEKRRLPEGASASTIPEQQARQFQQNTRDQLLQNRNQDQIKQADLDKFKQLQEVLFGLKK